MRFSAAGPFERLGALYGNIGIPEAKFASGCVHVSRGHDKLVYVGIAGAWDTQSMHIDCVGFYIIVYGDRMHLDAYNKDDLKHAT